MSNIRYVIGIGAQKSGTSWLADYLSGHPDVFVSPIKELHFFDSLYRPELCAGLERRLIKAFVDVSHKIEMVDVLKDTRRFKRFRVLSSRAKMGGDIERYRNYFKDLANNESVFCEVTPEYALLDQAGYQAIKSLADDVRLIFLIRNPIDRFWSAVRMRAKGNPQINIVNDFESFLEKPHFYECTDYEKTLSTVYKVFPKERVFVQFYEQLFDPNVISQLCRFCGIDFIDPDTEKRVLEGVPSALTEAMRERIYDKFHHVFDWAENTFGENLPVSWRTDISAFRRPLATSTIKTKPPSMGAPEKLAAPTFASCFVSPLRRIRKNEKSLYPNGVSTIGGIYDSSDKPHIDSLLRRGKSAVFFQAHEHDLKIDHNTAKGVANKAIYGGMLTNHFGHFLLESLARTWYLYDSTGDIYFYRMQGLKEAGTYDSLPNWQRTVLSHLAGDLSRIKFIDGPLLFDELTVPEAGLINRHFCAAEQRKGMLVLGERITAKCTTNVRSAKVWLSRSLLKKGAIAGEKRFEDALSNEGFFVVHPETFSLAEQIKLFEQASVVAGFTGSAFHTVLFAKNNGTKLLHFSRLSELNGNYIICSEAAGFDSEFHNCFIRYGKVKGLNGNVLQNLSGIWGILYQQGLVETEKYCDLEMESDLDFLDMQLQKIAPQLFK
ncbi:glycosyltransferase 61 family protein [Methylovulum miyakonense]|uniref:glycosyltransferase 61 family protein n=1 Tax=Methylovulum miyakonense TaxID=645578 RepID=UPI000399F491|nr:glycosyltransferase 61 family protein [Methylovulum miyakonense]